MVLLFCSASGCGDTDVRIRTCVTEDDGTDSGMEIGMEAFAGNATEDEHTDASRSTDTLGTKKAETTALVVHVCGAVAAQGIYTLSEGSRVADAVKAAGGMRTDAAEAAVNLAREITDGEQIYIPTEAEWQNGHGSGFGTLSEQDASGSDGQVDINHADASLLTTLPGIGATRAADIIAYRDAHGSFEKTEDLMKVPGIKEGTYQKLKDHICVK